MVTIGRGGRRCSLETHGDVCLKETPDVGAPATLIHRIRKRIGVVRQRSRVSRGAIRAIFNEATERGGRRWKARTENTTAGKLDNRAVGHGRTPKKEVEP